MNARARTQGGECRGPLGVLKRAGLFFAGSLCLLGKILMTNCQQQHLSGAFPLWGNAVGRSC